jgi:hypothetical protein
MRAQKVGEDGLEMVEDWDSWIGFEEAPVFGFVDDVLPLVEGERGEERLLFQEV